MKSSQSLHSPASLIAGSLVPALLICGLSFTAQAQTADDEVVEEIVVKGIAAVCDSRYL